jgi:FkbM family methyltransferase
MNTINTTLNKEFVILDLGSSYAKQNKFLKKCSSQITYIELDALSNSEINNTDLYKSIKIKKGVHAQKGLKTFYEREYLQCSSFLKFKPEVNDMYDLVALTKTKNELQLDCTTVNEILAENNLNKIDFLKTDLEGLDFDIIKSLGDKIKDVNVIQSEIRFQPLFEGEKPFYEICSYLNEMGFEFINFGVLDEWKLNTTNNKNYRDGRMVWGDFVFFKKLNVQDANFETDILKQILIAKSLNFNSYAEYLLESNKHHLNSNLYTEIAKEMNTFTILELFLNNLFYFISSFKIIYPIRKGLKYFYQRSRILNKFKQLIA